MQTPRRKAGAAAVAVLGLTASLAVAPPAYASVPWTTASSTDVGAQSLVVTGASAPDVTRAAAVVGIAPPSANQPTGVTNVDWAKLVLVDGGWPVSADNVTVMLQWMDSENGADDWWNRNNPLNNGYGSGGGAGFGSYADLVVAAAKVAENLHRGGGYAAIVSDFAASAPAGTTAQAIWQSPWAGGHYNNGAIWHRQAIPIVSAPASAW